MPLLQATPMVSGAAALVRQYFRSGFYQADLTAAALCGAGTKYNCAASVIPSAAMMKVATNSLHLIYVLFSL
jgi:hypothetical protein